MNQTADAGQRIYSKRVLSLYDLWVLGFSNHLLWKCPTRLISQQFRNRVSPNHLDVGVGSGYYLKKHLPHNQPRIALMDLNQNSLTVAANAIKAHQAEVYCRNVLAPLHLPCERFDSVSINYLLHCLPGSMADKSVVFAHLKTCMNDGAVLFGSTILGAAAVDAAPGNPPLNRAASKLMAFYNQKGIFSNRQDSLATLSAALTQHFVHVNIRLVGCVALFWAHKAHSADDQP
ncbi:class I SAM-dependent methyltransferase [Shewanella sp. YIC-542]|uniref:class I SAM-dependent methyltransferase n=1 Tax=Shewanella mytili TaxID=3377111 RepID=UPI00398F8527